VTPGRAPLETFFTALAFIGALTGFAAGALAARRGWTSARAFGATLIVVAAAGLALGIPAEDLPGSLAVILLAPLVGVVPAGAGFVIGRQAMAR
jgi:hypothetical protein